LHRVLPELDLIRKEQFGWRPDDELLNNLLEDNWISSSFLDNGAQERHATARICSYTIYERVGVL